MIATAYEPTISQVLDNFIIDRTSRGKSANTVRYYRVELHGLLAFFGEGVRMDCITADRLRTYFTELQKRRNRGGVHSVYRSLRVFLNWWEQETDGRFANPIRKVEIGAPQNRPREGVTLQDIQRLIDSCRTEQAQRDQTILRCLLDTGARAFEFVALNLGDIDLITGRVVIQRGKGDKERDVYLGASCRKAIRRYLKTRTRLNPATPLWISEDGERLTKEGLRSIITRRSRDAGIHPPGLHDFRRAFALNLWRNGVDLLAISHLMGHTTVEMTRRYIKPDEDDLRAKHQAGSPVDRAGL